MSNASKQFITNELHSTYIQKGIHATYSVGEGAVRAGKTTDNIALFHMLIEASPDNFHLVSASTENTAKVILGDGDGLGLEHIYAGRCKWTRVKDKEILVVHRFIDNKPIKIMFKGADKANSSQAIRGMSFGLWLSTELDLHHESFIKEARNRTYNSGLRRILTDFNPTHPEHMVYKYVENWRKGPSCNYQKFTIFDNPVMTPQRIKEIIAEYDTDSIWFKRDILGERIAPEGAIYTSYNEDTMLVDECPFTPAAYFVGVDWGYTGSGTAFTLIATDYYNIHVLVTMNYTEPRSSTKNLQLADKFHEDIREVAGMPVSYADYGDPGLTRDYKARYPMCKSRWSKLPVIRRIQITDHLMLHGRLTLDRENTKSLQKAIKAAVWVEGTMERLDDYRVYLVDPLDSFEYASHEVFKTVQKDLQYNYKEGTDE